MYRALAAVVLLALALLIYVTLFPIEIPTLSN